MKTTMISIRYSTEKLETLLQHRTETELQTGLETALRALYEMYVPAEIRETLDRQEKIVEV